MREEGRAPASGRVVPLLGGLAATAVLVALVFSLGSWGYKYRRWLFHHGRLQAMLEKRPSVDQVRIGLQGEGAQRLGGATGPAELSTLGARFPQAVRDTLAEKGRRAARTEAFVVGEMTYVVFFDRDEKMTDFLVVEREP